MVAPRADCKPICYDFARMAARLTVLEGKARGTALSLGEKPLIELGNNPLADVPVDDPDVARVHLKIHFDGDEFTAFDLSGRGFLLNSRRSLKAELHDGDVLQVGSTKLRFDLAPVLPPAPVAGVSDVAPVWVDEPRGPPEPPPPTAAQRWVLRATRGNDSGKEFPLDPAKDYYVIGRGGAADITIWDIRASRLHCRIDRDEGGLTITDLSSSNGTLVNGERITTHRLAPGDEVKIGHTVLRLTVE
jgi:pSer/pThr/pTyr-binding forkhead associated (FHA) protein